MTKAAWLFSLALISAPAFADFDFHAPTYSDLDAAKVLSGFDYIDPKHMVPDDLLKAALLYFSFNHEKIANQNVLGIVDFSKHSSVARWFFIDMKSGDVAARHVSHGKGSDPTTKKNPHGTGFARKFSNQENSKMSSLGFFLASDIYKGEHGISVHLDGLSVTNSNARERAIVIHQADYVIEENKLQGRSDGCFAVAPSERAAVVASISGGSLLYADISKN